MAVSLSVETLTATAAVVVPIAGVAVGYMRLALKDSISALKLDLIRELNGTYIRRGECGLMHDGLEKRVDRLEALADGVIEK